MPEINADKLREQAELMNLALESCLTEEQGRDLLNSKITDAYLLKLRVDLENRTGVLMVLVSKFKKTILQVFSVFGSSPQMRKVRLFGDYGQLSVDFVELYKEKGLDSSLTENVGKAVYRIFSPEIIPGLLPQWDKKYFSNSIDMLERGISGLLKNTKIKVIFEMDKVSSVKFRHKNPMHGVVRSVGAPPPETSAAPEQQAPVNAEPTALERQIANFTKNYNTILQAKTMISPVDGIEFDQLVEGQEILFKLIVDSPQQKATAKVLNAIDEYNIAQPVVGKYIGIASGKNEYHIYAEGPSGTLLHSLEERPVKISVPKYAKKMIETKQSDSSGMFLMAGIGALVIILVIVVALLI